MLELPPPKQPHHFIPFLTTSTIYLSAYLSEGARAAAKPYPHINRQNQQVKSSWRKVKEEEKVEARSGTGNYRQLVQQPSLSHTQSQSLQIKIKSTFCSFFCLLVSFGGSTTATTKMKTLCVCFEVCAVQQVAVSFVRLHEVNKWRAAASASAASAAPPHRRPNIKAADCLPLSFTLDFLLRQFRASLSASVATATSWQLRSLWCTHFRQTDSSCPPLYQLNSNFSSQKCSPPPPPPSSPLRCCSQQCCPAVSPFRGF